MKQCSVFRACQQQDELPRGHLPSLLRDPGFVFVRVISSGARADLDEAWTLPSAGPDAAAPGRHPPPPRPPLLSVRNLIRGNPPGRPRRTPRSSLTSVATTGRDEELADAKRAILGA